MSWLSNIFTPTTPVAPPAPAPVAAPVLPTIPGLAAALAAAAPKADPAVWVPALVGPLTAAGITTPRRVSALLGQVSAEAGVGLSELSENTNYSHADRLVAVFPREFPTLGSTAGYVGNPRAIACRVYAGRLGNGNEASGDGWVFRGAGLLQLTGRETITAFGVSVGMPPEKAADYLRTPAGASAGACWFWTRGKLNSLADTWSLSAITKAVNGPAMLGNVQRIAAANAALTAMGAA